MSPRVSALFGAVMVAIGVAMLVRTLAAGAGPASYGVLLGILFVVAGGGRLWVSRRRA